MHVDQLTRMANQIGPFFEAMPERDEARRSAVEHIPDFWSPGCGANGLSAWRSAD